MHDAGSTTSSCDTSSHTSDSSSHTSHTSHTSHSSGETWAGMQNVILNSNDPGYYYDNAKVRPGRGASRAEVTVLVAVILAIVILLIGLSLI